MQTLYVLANLVCYAPVCQTIETHKLGVIIMNIGDNKFDKGAFLIIEKTPFMKS